MLSTHLQLQVTTHAYLAQFNILITQLHKYNAQRTQICL